MTKISQLTPIGDSLATNDEFIIRDFDDAGTPNKSVTVSGITRALQDGTDAIPALAFANDKNTGIFRPGDDQLAISTNGAESAFFSQTAGRLAAGAIDFSATTFALAGGGATQAVTVTKNGVDILSLGVDGAGPRITSGGDLRFLTNGLERLRITSAGLVGIGISSPQAKLHVSGSQSVFGNDNLTRILADSQTIDFTNSTQNAYVAGRINGLNLKFYTNTGAGIDIDSSGRLLVGTSTAVLSSKFLSQYAGNVDNGAILNETANTASTTFLAFALSGTAIGSVTRVGATSAVAYNTTSDYRLKTIVGSVTGQGERIDALKPIDFQWKENGEQARGFLAHEFQTVYANSVTGKKDAVDADGNPVYQAMQASTAEIIADLVAEIQSLRARVADLEAA